VSGVCCWGSRHAQKLQQLCGKFGRPIQQFHDLRSIFIFDLSYLRLRRSIVRLIKGFFKPRRVIPSILVQYVRVYAQQLFFDVNGGIVVRDTVFANIHAVPRQPRYFAQPQGTGKAKLMASASLSSSQTDNALNKSSAVQMSRVLATDFGRVAFATGLCPMYSQRIALVKSTIQYLMNLSDVSRRYTGFHDLPFVSRRAFNLQQRLVILVHHTRRANYTRR